MIYSNIFFSHQFPCEAHREAGNRWEILKGQILTFQRLLKYNKPYSRSGD